MFSLILLPAKEPQLLQAIVVRFVETRTVNICLYSSCPFKRKFKLKIGIKVKYTGNRTNYLKVSLFLTSRNKKKKEKLLSNARSS